MQPHIYFHCRQCKIGETALKSTHAVSVFWCVRSDKPCEKTNTVYNQPPWEEHMVWSFFSHIESVCEAWGVWSKTLHQHPLYPQKTWDPEKKTPYACRMWVYVETVAVVHTTAAHCLAQMEIGACLMFRDPRGGDKNISQGLLPLVNLWRIEFQNYVPILHSG